MVDLIQALALALALHTPSLPSSFGWTAAAQIEHESRWNPQAMRRVGRETGCGLTQVSKVEGRFDNLSAYVAKHPELHGWNWRNCTEIKYQMLFFAVFTEDTARAAPRMIDALNTRAAAVAAYNAGTGGVRLDQRTCAMTKGCDGSRWFGHVENVCARSAIVSGRRACDITKGYVRRVMSDASRTRYAVVDRLIAKHREARKPAAQIEVKNELTLRKDRSDAGHRGWSPFDWLSRWTW